MTYDLSTLHLSIYVYFYFVYLLIALLKLSKISLNFKFYKKNKLLNNILYFIIFKNYNGIHENLNT